MKAQKFLSKQNKMAKGRAMNKLAYTEEIFENKVGEQMYRIRTLHNTCYVFTYLQCERIFTKFDIENKFNNGIDLKKSRKDAARLIIEFRKKALFS